MDQDMLDLIGLFYSYTNPDTVDARLDEHLLILVACDNQWIQEDLG